jgi:hypothetical protein
MAQSISGEVAVRAYEKLPLLEQDGEHVHYDCLGWNVYGELANTGHHRNPNRKIGNRHLATQSTDFS